jgi:hypothetical protein
LQQALILLVLLLFEHRINLGAFFPLNLFPLDRVETLAQLGNVPCDLRGAIDDWGGIEDSMTVHQDGQRCAGCGLDWLARFYDVPLRIGTCGQGLAHSWRTIAQANITVPATRITKLGKAPVFFGHHKIRALVTH